MSKKLQIDISNRFGVEETVDDIPVAKSDIIKNIPKNSKGSLGDAFKKEEYNKIITVDQKIKMFVDRAILLAKKLGAIDENGNLIEDKLIKDSETLKVMRITKFGKNPVIRFTNGKVVDPNKPSQQAVEFMIHLSDNKLSNTLNSKLDIELLKKNLSLFEIKKIINI